MVAAFAAVRIPEGARCHEDAFPTPRSLVVSTAADLGATPQTRNVDLAALDPASTRRSSSGARAPSS
jgi:hypothetical protein